MSTYITVTSDSGSLVSRVKQVQQANREAQLQRQRDTALEAEIANESQFTTALAERPIGGNPDTSIARRPSAQRYGSTPFPVYVTRSWQPYPDDRSSFFGEEPGIEVSPVYDPGASIRLTGSEPQISFLPDDPLNSRGPENIESLHREHSLVLPIDNKSAIVVYLFDVEINTCSTGFEDFSTAVANYRSRSLKCAVVGLDSAREISTPAVLDARLTYLYPPVPAPSYPVTLDVYEYIPGPTPAQDRVVLIGQKEAIQGYWPQGTLDPFGLPLTGDSWRFWYDPAMPWSTQVMAGYGIGNLQEVPGFDVGANPGSTQIGYHGNDLWGAGVYDVLLRYDKSGSSGAAVYDPDLWGEYDIPVVSQYLNLAAFRGWVDVNTTLEGANEDDPQSALREFRFKKTTQITSVGTTVNTTGWKRLRPSDLRQPFLMPSYGISNLLQPPNYAYDWGNRSYCRAQLLQLGFTPEDLTP